MPVKSAYTCLPKGHNPGFSLLFEALLLQLCSAMPVHQVAKIINVSDNKIWRLLDQYIDTARNKEDHSEVTMLGIDETSKSKGHHYISLFVDLKKKKTTFVAEGRSHQAVVACAQDLRDHNGDPDKVTDVSCDMSAAFIKGVSENFTNAEITFDRFHITKLINEAVDQVRRQEVASQPILKGNRYLFLKNSQNLTGKQAETLETIRLSKLNLKTVKALNIRESFQSIYQAESTADFEVLLKKWYFWATHSRLEPIIKVAKTVKTHWDGVVRWKQSQINNGILEGLNSVIQAAKSKARGFKTFKNYKIIVYLVTGKLNFTAINANYKAITG
jgi:transposase